MCSGIGYCVFVVFKFEGNGLMVFFNKVRFVVELYFKVSFFLIVYCDFGWFMERNVIWIFIWVF